MFGRPSVRVSGICSPLIYICYMKNQLRIFCFNTCTVNLLYFYYNQQMCNYLIKVVYIYIKRVFVIYTAATCFDTFVSSSGILQPMPCCDICCYEIILHLLFIIRIKNLTHSLIKWWKVKWNVLELTIIPFRHLTGGPERKGENLSR